MIRKVIIETLVALGCAGLLYGALYLPLIFN